MAFEKFKDLPVPMDEQLQREVIERAKEAPKGEIVDGKCSKCGFFFEGVDEKTPNFCAKCEATFLTDEEIEAAEAALSSETKE